MARRTVQFADSPEQALSEQDKVHRCETLFSAADTERKKAEQEWLANVAILAGHHSEAVLSDSLRYRRTTSNLYVHKADDRQNLLYALTRQAAAAGVDAFADQIAVPATSESLDMEAAEIATDLIAHRYDADDEYTLRLHEELWRLTCGICYRLTLWDPAKDGYGRGGAILKGAGDIDTMVLTPFHVHVCPWVDSSKMRPWYIVSDVMDVDEIKDLYGVEVLPEEVARESQAYTRLMSSVVTGEGGAVTPRKHAALRHVLYHRPGGKYADGQVWTWANGKMLDETDLPEGEMPIVEKIWFPVPGRIYPYAFITPLRPLQIEIDRTMSQLVELKNRQLRGDMVVKGKPPVEGTQEPVTPKRNEDTGQKVIYLDPVIQEWEFVKYDMDTAEAHALTALKWQNMQIIAGVNSGATLGTESESERTLGELQMRRQADVAGLSLFRKMGDHQQSKVERLKLVDAKNHYIIERTIRVVGEAAAPKTRSFYGAELRGTDDVRPRPVPLLSETEKGLIRQKLAELGAWDFTGRPTQIANRVQMVLSSGLPDAREEIEKMLPGISVEQIFEAAGMSVQQQLEVGLKEQEARGVMADQVIAQTQPPAEDKPQGVMAEMAA